MRYRRLVNTSGNLWDTDEQSVVLAEADGQFAYFQATQARAQRERNRLHA